MSTLLTDGSPADIQAKIDLAVAGDVVDFPPGRFVLSSTINYSKGIHLRGRGAGRVLARSASSVDVGTGAKEFTLIKENVASIAALRSGLVLGTILKICRTGGEQNGTLFGSGMVPWLRGTVTSLSGDTLTMNITSVSSDVGGTHSLWTIATEAATILAHGGPANSRMIIAQEDPSHHVEFSGIRFEYDVSSGREEVQQLLINSVPGGKPALVHDCYFERTHTGTLVRTRRGIFWNCSFVSPVMAFNGLAIQNVDLNYGDSWTTPSTMGAADTTGTANLYVEDCDFHAFISATDCDSNSRAVFRNVLIDHASLASHGADTGPYGVRHVEIYDSEFAFVALGNGQTIPLDRQINIRGGTWVITGNIIPHLQSQDWGSKIDIAMECQNIQLNAGPNPGFGYNVPGVQYPCPRQVGMGRVTGNGKDGFGRSVDSVTYVGDSEPAYFWDNTGNPGVAVKEYGYIPGKTVGSSEEDFNANADRVNDYIQQGRDYFVGTAKPGWSRFVYPHPLRSGAWVPAPSPEPTPVPVPAPTPVPVPTPTPTPTGEAPTITVWPQSQTVKKKANVTFTVAATGTPTIRYQWFRAGVAIAGATGPSLTLKSVNPGDRGEYVVGVTNDFGGQLASARLDVR